MLIDVCKCIYYVDEDLEIDLIYRCYRCLLYMMVLMGCIAFIVYKTNNNDNTMVICTNIMGIYLPVIKGVNGRSPTTWRFMDWNIMYLWWICKCHGHCFPKAMIHCATYQDSWNPMGPWATWTLLLPSQLWPNEIGKCLS